MGHYCIIKFSAELSEIGVEVVDYLMDHSILEATKEFPQYPFLEAFINRFDLGRFPINQFLREEQTLVVNWEHKIKNYDSALKFILPYLIKSEVNFNYASEHGDWKERVSVILPKTPMVDFERDFGDATGIEI